MRTGRFLYWLCKNLLPMRGIVFILLAISIFVFGCAGSESGEEKVTPSPTPAETPAISPTPEKTKAQELHGVGKCDQCHDAPTVSDMAAGLHKEAFVKQPDIHKKLCSDCHDVSTFCGKCHDVPEVVK